MNVWDKALTFENEGRDFYLKRAEESVDDSLRNVFSFLAKEEERHIKLIENYMSYTSVDLPENDFLQSINSFFDAKSNDIPMIYTQSEQLAIYHLARDIEEKGINLYDEMYKLSDNDQERRVISYLRDQEIKHHELFDELVKRVGRPEEWVESAEFGEREDY